jgi:hypothetical protein
MRAIVFFFVASLPLFSQTECIKTNFEPGKSSKVGLTSEFQGAVLRLKASEAGDSGTGYLIDSTNGYVITASHVVASSPPGTSIEVTSPDATLANVKLAATVVKSLGTKNADGSLSGPDVAILQLKNPILVKGLRPVDISLRSPSSDDELFTMGYEKPYAEEIDPPFRVASVTFMSNPSDGSIEVTQAIFGGNSGAPLMDHSGSVVGTCRNEFGTGNTVARYTPMIDGEALLAFVPMSDRMKDIDQKIKSGSITEDALRRLMVKSSRNPTNLELYTWAQHVYANLDKYATDPVHKLIQCSMHALSQRGFETFVVSASLKQAAANPLYHLDTKSIDLQGPELSPLVDPKTLGDASIQVAEREIAQGRFLSAENHVKVATASYAAANDALGTYRTAMVSTCIQLAVGSIDAAQSLSTKVLAHLEILPAKDKSTALSVAASIDLAKGNRFAAIPKFIAASGYSIAAGQFTTAADLLMSSADASIKLNKPQDAKEALKNDPILMPIG